ncbi:DUF3263 domain-containing protein [Corynebacterium aquilae]|uniref:Fis family transcriptional regulator n=1 Tax=Corynebacterium aquilae DSM 44791 TaxID=1431546 RepID=A0A1L7CI36_9CORY|nr:DUF3263 domain-containing protein [Corynebacterium aquilae]APT85520.1 hypothetical protein CAQU_11220 [Corynebacterium aquilae DSM 44791]
MGLSEFDRRLLDCASRLPRQVGARDEMIRAELGVSSTRFFQRLNVLLDSAEALEYAPALVRRLQRVRSGRGVPGA